jgi:hypothetical protein
MVDTDTRSSIELENELWKLIQDANTECDNKILSGMVWNGMSIWLSSENQFNFKAFYDLAVQGKVTYPQTFKFNDTFYSFTDFTTLEDFYISSIHWIQQCLSECWQKKALIQSEYDELIKSAKEKEESNTEL